MAGVAGVCEFRNPTVEEQTVGSGCAKRDHRRGERASALAATPATPAKLLPKRPAPVRGSCASNVAATGPATFSSSSRPGCRGRSAPTAKTAKTDHRRRREGRGRRVGGAGQAPPLDAQSPEPRAQSPEPRAQSPEPDGRRSALAGTISMLLDQIIRAPFGRATTPDTGLRARLPRRAPIEHRGVCGERTSVY
ncbi:hypothetical protein KM043_007382 [Ampulex compressa]|nr:hypothetical protein KM043_007382 [Ampulex compressa]